MQCYCANTGPCARGNYTLIDDYRRSVDFGDGRACDRDAGLSGWYRFQLNGTDAVMPTTCVPVSFMNSGL